MIAHTHHITMCAESCWRKCGEPGSMQHIFCHCNSLTSFWSQICKLICEVTGSIWNPQPAMAILYIGCDCIPWNTRTIVFHIFTAVKNPNLPHRCSLMYYADRTYSVAMYKCSLVIYKILSISTRPGKNA